MMCSEHQRVLSGEILTWSERVARQRDNLDRWRGAARLDEAAMLADAALLLSPVRRASIFVCA